MYSEQQQDIYILHKFLLAIIFNGKIGILDKTWVYDLDMLKAMKLLIKELVENSLLSNREKNIVYDFLIDARSIKDEFYKERIEIINDIIYILNSQKYDNSTLFLRHQLSIRTGDTKFINRYSDEKIEQYREGISDSIYIDFFIIISHLDSISDDGFKEDYFNCITNNEVYYSTINIILQECPSLLKNEIFKNRMMMVFEENKKTDKKYKRKNKILIKRLKNNLV